MDTSLKARMSPHLGLLTIAGILDRLGHEVRLINGNTEEIVIPDGTDLVGITVTIDVLPKAIELAHICRRIPRSPSQWMPYALFNLFYRKYGRLTEQIGERIGFDRVGAIARRLSYGR